jgi:hypothetical protein
MTIFGILAAFAVVLVIAVIAGPVYDWFNRSRARVDLDQSNGTLDAHAARSLDRLGRIRAKTPADRIRAADIIRFHVLENVPTIWVAEEYARAVEQARAERVALDQFQLDHVIQLIGYAAVAPVDRVEDMVSAAKSGAADKPQAVRRGLQSLIKHTSDGQNVHDSKVGAELRTTLDRLDDISEDPDSLLAYLRGEFKRAHPDKCAGAVSAVDRMYAGEYVSTYGASECEILDRVWARASHADNQANAENIREAIGLALADMVTESGFVCANGRAARALGALAGVDADPTMGAAMTYEAYKNQIYEESMHIADEVLAEAKTDPGLAAEASAAVGAPTPGIDARILAEVEKNLEKYSGVLRPDEYATIRRAITAAIA